jgi:hypothetical protein
LTSLPISHTAIGSFYSQLYAFFATWETQPKPHKYGVFTGKIHQKNRPANAVPPPLADISGKNIANSCN